MSGGDPGRPPQTIRGNAAPAAVAPARPPTDARLQAVEAQADATAARLAAIDRRLDALASKIPSSPDRVGQVISGVGLAASTLIAVAGFGIVHTLSVRRQRRDEFFKRVQDCLTILDRLGRDAAKVWRKPGRDNDAVATLDFIQADIDALSHRLGLMVRLQPSFDIKEGLIEFKREATLDVEDPRRPADPVRADRALRLAQHLSRVILEQYDKVY